MLLYDQRDSMRSVEVDMDTVLGLLDSVHSSAGSITVQKEQSKKLQQEILDNYASYREAIERSYINAEEKV